MSRWKRVKNGLWDALGIAQWPGMDRRLLAFPGPRLGYRSTKFPLIILFLPHVAMILALALALPVGAVAWVLGVPLTGDFWLFACIGLPFSLPFLPFAVLFLGHRATLVDGGRGRVSEWRGIGLPLLPIIPLMMRRHPLSRFSELRLDLRLSGTAQNASEVYVLTLVGGGGGDCGEVLVVEAQRLITARRIAERLARLCQLPLRDRSAGEHRLRQVEDLDKPLVESESEAGWPASPRLSASSRLQLPERGARPWEVALPRPVFRGWRALLILVIGVVLAWAAQSARPRLEALGAEAPPPVERPAEEWTPPSPWPGRLARAAAQGLTLVQIVAVFGAAGGLLGLLVQLAARPHGWRIVVDAGGLCVYRLGLLGRRRRRQSLAKLEELRVQEHAGHWRLLALSDRHAVPVGGGLSKAEAQALRQELVLALRREAGDVPPDP